MRPAESVREGKGDQWLIIYLDYTCRLKAKGTRNPDVERSLSVAEKVCHMIQSLEGEDQKIQVSDDKNNPTSVPNQGGHLSAVQLRNVMAA